MDQITNFLEELYPNAKCELKYNKDYELLIAVMLSAQTTDIKVNEITEVLFNKYKTIDKLKNANINDIKNIIRPLGNYNKKSFNIIEISNSLYNNYNGIVPNNREYLESLPGVGRKTTNVVLSNLFDENVIAVDTHVARVSYRLSLCKKDDTPLEIEKKLTKKYKTNLLKLHHQLIFFGRYKCKAINPLCSDCKLKDICRYEKKDC